jgi:hypothetical protein
MILQRTRAAARHIASRRRDQAEYRLTTPRRRETMPTLQTIPWKPLQNEICDGQIRGIQGMRPKVVAEGISPHFEMNSKG